MRVSVSEGGTMERSVAEELERHVDDGLYAVPEVHEWSEGCDCAHDPEQGCCNEAGTAGPKADVGAAQPASNRPQLGSGGDPPCEPDVSRGPPPWPASAQERVAWWGDCTPKGAVGPGADGCDLEHVWWDALALCNGRCLEESASGMGLSVSEYLDRYESGCHENYVDWVWVDEGCRVTDAECGTVSDGQPGPWLLVQLVGDSAVWFYPDAAEVDDPAQPEDVVHGGWGLIPDAGFIRLDLYEDEVPEQDPGSDNSETYWESFDWEDYENGLSEEDEDTYWGWMSLYQDYDDEELAALVADCDAQEDPVAYWSKSCMAARKEQSDRMDSAEDGEEGFMDPIGMQDPCGPVGPALC